MLARILEAPDRSFLLLGARGTGKSTWLGQKIQAQLNIDLLHSEEFLTYSRDPSHLRKLCGPLPEGSWVIIDEVQRVPQLMNEVHSIYETQRLNFAVSGSSARKLKRGGANLLAGRALRLQMFPMVFAEYGSRQAVEDTIDWGSLPLIVGDSKTRREVLSAYLENYIRQELIEEGVIRGLDPFMRFLEVAGLANGQVLNIQNIAREARVGRGSVDNYFNILYDTLIATRLPAFLPRAKVKEASHPKFFFFDSGVARACAGLLYDSVDSSWRGFALETVLLNELLAYNHYSQRNRPIFHYNVSGSYDIDFVIQIKKKTSSQKSAVICVETKHATKWDSRWCKPLNDFANNGAVEVLRRIGVYRGTERLQTSGVDVYPLKPFLEALHRGEIF